MKSLNRPTEWRGYTFDELKSRRMVTQVVLNVEFQKIHQRLVPQQSSVFTRYLSKIITQLTDLIPHIRTLCTIYRQIKDLF